MGGKEDWKKHFLYLLDYFRDERYIRIDGKPVFIIYNYSEQIGEMDKYWNYLARENGINGVYFIYKNSSLNHLPKKTDNFSYEPIYSGFGNGWKIWAFKVLSLLNIISKVGPIKYSYDKTWKKILKNASRRKQPYEWHGAFVSYDDTPRRGKSGRLFIGNTPEKFKKYLGKLIDICNQQNKEFIFLTAWNEWGEGAMLEPSKKDGYRYLKAIESLIDEKTSKRS